MFNLPKLDSNVDCDVGRCRNVRRPLSDMLKSPVFYRIFRTNIVKAFPSQQIAYDGDPQAG